MPRLTSVQHGVPILKAGSEAGPMSGLLPINFDIGVPIICTYIGATWHFMLQIQVSYENGDPGSQNGYDPGSPFSA